MYASCIRQTEQIYGIYHYSEGNLFEFKGISSYKKHAYDCSLEAFDNTHQSNLAAVGEGGTRWQMPLSRTFASQKEVGRLYVSLHVHVRVCVCACVSVAFFLYCCYFSLPMGSSGKQIE